MTSHIIRTWRGAVGLVAAAMLTAAGSASLYAEDSSAAIISQSSALRHGLKRPLFLHIDADGARDKLSFIGQQRSTLFLQTTEGIVHSVNAETGHVDWRLQLGDGGLTGFTPAANENFVAVVYGSTVFLLKRANGDLEWKAPLTSAPTAGPAINDDSVYVPTSSGLIEIMPIKVGPKYSAKTVRSSGTVISPPIITPHNVAWTTEDGTVGVYRTDTQKLRFQFKPGGEMASSPGYRDGVLFVGSQDGYVYAIDENAGTTLWQFPTAEEVRQSPAAIGGSVYVVTESGSMFRLSAENGQEIWHARGMRRFQSASPTKVYAEDRMSRLAIIDVASGSVQDTMPLSASLSLRPANVQSDRLYLASASGMVQSLHEMELDTPADYLPPLEDKSQPEKTKKEKSAPTQSTAVVSHAAPAAKKDPVAKKEPVAKKAPLEKKAKPMPIPKKK